MLPIVHFFSLLHEAGLTLWIIYYYYYYFIYKIWQRWHYASWEPSAQDASCIRVCWVSLDTAEKSPHPWRWAISAQATSNQPADRRWTHEQGLWDQPNPAQVSRTAQQLKQLWDTYMFFVLSHYIIKLQLTETFLSDLLWLCVKYCVLVDRIQRQTITPDWFADLSSQC